MLAFSFIKLFQKIEKPCRYLLLLHRCIKSTKFQTNFRVSIFCIAAENTRLGGRRRRAFCVHYLIFADRSTRC
jgi:hypothetical protein